MSEPFGATTPRTSPGMTRASARRLEYSIIGLGIVALLLIFQPFSPTLYGVGCGLVVLAGLVNNLLPLCQPGTQVRSVVNAALIVALIFCIVMLLSIAAAHVYGVLFVTSLSPDTSEPFYRVPFVWGVACVAAVLAGLVTLLNKAGPKPE